MEIVLAVFLGTLFGFALHRVGASNPENIIAMLRLRDLHLMKAILLAIGSSSVLLFAGLAAGWIDPSHVAIKTSTYGVLVGGGLLGIGFGAAGYCPGTGWAAVADGRKDAVAFVVGGLVGALAYLLSHPLVEQMGPLAAIAGGKTTLAETGGQAHALVGGSAGWVLGIALGFVIAALAWMLPSRSAGTRARRERASRGFDPKPHGVNHS